MSITRTIYRAINVSRVSKVPVLFLSNPGVGKTTIVYDYAKKHNFKVTELRGSTSSPEDIIGYFVNEGKDYLNVKYPEWFIKLLEDGKKDIPHILFLDEITTVGKATQAALLKLIFDREIHGKKLPESCVIVSAGNYASNLAHGFGLLTPVLNRFCIVNLKADKKTYLEYVYSDIVTSDDIMFPTTLSAFDKELVENNISKYIDKVISKFSVSSKRDIQHIINLNNTDYTAVDNVDGCIYGILTPRTVSYLSKMTKACLQLDYNSDVDFIPLGLIGFGSGEVTDEEILVGYHKYICDGFNSIISNKRSEDELQVHFDNISKVTDDLKEYLGSLSDTSSSVDYIMKLSILKDSMLALDEALAYHNDFNVTAITSINTDVFKVLKYIKSLDKSKNASYAKIIYGRYEHAQDIILEVIVKTLESLSKIVETRGFN